MVSLAKPDNELFTREGEAPAEPVRRQLGRSLALPQKYSQIRIPVLRKYQNGVNLALLFCWTCR